MAARLVLGVFAALPLWTSAVQVSPEWCIAVPDQNCGITAVLTVGAEELQADIRESLGFELKIVPYAKAKAPAFYFGAEAAKRAGFDLNGFTNWDNTYAEKGGSVYFFGADKSRKTGWVKEWWCMVFPSFRAMTRFVEDQLGVRHLMPGRTGTEVPKKKALDIAAGTVSHERPTQDYGSSFGPVGTIAYHIANGVYPSGLYHDYGGHSYGHACPAKFYGKTHPEYFGMKSGKRVVGGADSVLCISNPDVQQLMIDEMVRRFDEGSEACQLNQQDGFSGCECANCAAYGGEVAKGDWGEKLWILHTDLARRVAKIRPGKKVYVLSYGPTVHPPKSFRKFPENFMVMKCSYTEEAFQEWKDYSVPGGFLVYVYHWGEFPKPGFSAKLDLESAAEHPRILLRNKVHGIFRCGYGELYGTEGPAYYVYNRTLIDPTRPTRDLFVEYCTNAYGPSSAQMMKFHEVQSKRLAIFNHRNYPKNPLDYFACAYTPDVLKEMESDLSRAEHARGLEARHKRRLALVRYEFDYVKNLSTIAVLHAAYKAKPCREIFRILAQTIKARNAFLGNLYVGPRKTRPIEGWPEMRVFGPDQNSGGGVGFARQMMNTNGRLGAHIGAPLGWDVDSMLANLALPGCSMKRMSCSRTTAKPTLDDFESGDWAKSEWQTLGGVQLQKISQKARFKALYDDKALYLAVESDLKDDHQVREAGHDGAIWSDESIDLMLDPTGSREIAYHFMWSPRDGSQYDEALGLITDPLHPLFGKFDKSYDNFDWTTQNRRANNTWYSLVTIPFSVLGATAPKAGDLWCLNLGREWFSWRGPEFCVDALWSPDIETNSFKSREAMGELIFK